MQTGCHLTQRAFGCRAAPKAFQMGFYAHQKFSCKATPDGDLGTSEIQQACHIFVRGRSSCVLANRKGEQMLGIGALEQNESNQKGSQTVQELILSSPHSHCVTTQREATPPPSFPLHHL